MDNWSVEQAVVEEVEHMADEILRVVNQKPE